MDDIIFFDNLNKDTCSCLIKRYIDEYKDKIPILLKEDIILENILKDQETLRYGARGIKRKVKKEILNQLEISNV